MEELRQKIESFTECNSCAKVSNYPAEWLEEITTKQKAVFKEYSTKAERTPLITAIKKEYSDKFDAEGREVKIPFDGGFYTLIEAKAKLVELELVEVEAKLARETEIANVTKLCDAKQYLADTDFKMASDYDQDVTDVLVLRQEARDLIRSLEDN